MPSVCKDMVQVGLAYIASGSANQCSPGKQVVSILKNVNVHLLYNPAILLLWVFSSEIKIYVYAKICRQMFIAAFFNITIERTQISISWSMYKQNMAYVLDQSFNVANLLFSHVAMATLVAQW